MFWVFQSNLERQGPDQLLQPYLTSPGEKVVGCSKRSCSARLSMLDRPVTSLARRIQSGAGQTSFFQKRSDDFGVKPLPLKQPAKLGIQAQIRGDRQNGGPWRTGPGQKANQGSVVLVNRAICGFSLSKSRPMMMFRTLRRSSANNEVREYGGRPKYLPSSSMVFGSQLRRKPRKSLGQGFIFLRALIFTGAAQAIL